MSSTNYYRQGMTLIEVVAGLALMGTLLAAMLSAKGGYVRQQQYAQRVLTAVALADEFLVSHWHNIEALELIGGGRFSQHDGLTWSVTRIDDASAADWYCKILRFRVVDATGSADDPPLVSVDLLIPDDSALQLAEDALYDTRHDKLGIDVEASGESEPVGTPDATSTRDGGAS